MVITGIRFTSMATRVAVAVTTVILGIGLGIAGGGAAQAASVCAPDSGPNFAGKTPSLAQLRNDSLRCADFQGATLNKLAFEQADLTGADFRRATVVDSDFTQATLTGADFTGATLTDTSFEQADMGGVTLTGIHATRADFEQVSLSGVSLAGAQLQDADLSQATLTRANLSNADLRGASLDQADLTGANLVGANIAGADLTESTTTNTDATGIQGLTPLDLFAAVIALIVALLALRPRLSRAGRAGAWLVILVMAALTAVQGFAAAGWRPTSDVLFVLPFLTPVIFIAIFVARAIRRVRDGWAAAVIALVALVGFYLLTAAGLAFITDTAFGILPFSDTCSSASCGYGVARGGLGIGIGVALIVISAILSRLRSLARPAPNLAKWAAMQAGDLPAFVPSNGAGVASQGTGAAGPQNYDPPPPTQTISAIPSQSATGVGAIGTLDA